MALNLTTLEADLNKVVSEATTYVDLVDKYADLVKDIPLVGTDAAPIVAVLDEVTKALNALNAALNA
jgi:hypothetical protein